MMSKCVKCGSYAFNLYKEDIDQGGLCDVHYWQGRAHRAEALAEQPERPYRQLQDNGSKYFGESWDKAEQPAQQEPVAYAEQSILDWLAESARGPTAYAKTTLAKRKDGKAQIPLYTSLPAQRKWVGLEKSDMPTDPDPMYDHKYFTSGMVYAANKLMEKNT